ncbi:MAG: rod shape-determining protein [Tissierellia bacterium]|nr:rod shape-determining protein [Tissierellia bacterium]
MSALRAELTMDLGTDNVILYQRGKGVILSEPTVVAIDRMTDKFFAVGEQAQRMLGKTPDTIRGIKPILNGQVAEYEITKRLIKYLVQKSLKMAFVRPHMVVGVPAGSSMVARTALLEVCQEAGLSKVYLMEAPLATAMAEGLDVEKPLGRMVLDIGAGLAQGAIISLGSVVVGRNISTAGDAFDKAIVDGIRKAHGVAIGIYTAKDIKHLIGALTPQPDDRGLRIAGRDIATGLPREIIITSDDVRFMLEDSFSEILDMLEQLLEETPEELVTDIHQHGLLITGGSSELKGITDRLRAHLKIPVRLATNKRDGVALGLGKSLDSMPLLEDKLKGLVEAATTRTKEE